ncbi:hypothetical protein AAFF_G00228690 [Aldrovandia affinis]|uniref:Uncharacterized protein n=1 Tax=Aldrovandia affinis TaxID=143900 RepID=A0AAD7WUG1_9TELE|nr:hypothetical protein AAFF_G00228690 [Aldrovandia affinis]
MATAEELTASLPADFRRMLRDAARRAGLTMPLHPPPPTHSKLTDFYKAKHYLPHAHAMPPFPDFMDFVKGTWAALAKAVLPARRFSPFTNMESWSEEYATGTAQVEDGVQA